MKKAAGELGIDRNDWIFVYQRMAALPPSHYFTTDAASVDCLRLHWALKADINSAAALKFRGRNKFPIVLFHSLSFPETIVAKS